MKMRAHGLEKTKVCGRRRSERRDFLREGPRLRLPEAFSIIDLDSKENCISYQDSGYVCDVWI